MIVTFVQEQIIQNIQNSISYWNELKYRNEITYGTFIAIVLLLFSFVSVGRFITNFIACLYPLYLTLSYLTILDSKVPVMIYGSEAMRLLMYWSCFTTFNIFEMTIGFLLNYFPSLLHSLYYIFKLGFLFYVLHYNGDRDIYNKYLLTDITPIKEIANNMVNNVVNNVLVPHFN
jgi:hypothetical protein